MTIAEDIQRDFRTPRNTFQEAQGSIHNDAVASKLGFKGGTVPGSIHMDQFVPLLVARYGPAWFETGGLSLYFVQATVDAERVRATLEPAEAQARLAMFNEAGNRICEGTGNVGGLDEASELSRRMAAQAPAEPGRLRILADLAVGDENRDIAVRVEAEHLAQGRSTITEDMDVYARDLVLPPSHVVRLAHQTRPVVMARQKPAVGLFGALEAQQLAGPLRAGVDYAAHTRILKLTESPKTENAWYEVIFAQGGRDLGRVLYCLRFMKASSPLWAA